MEILKILKVEQREWENIRSSLQGCGDIGEFDSKKYIEGASTPLHQDLPLFRNLIEMEKKLPKHGYFTQEAAFVFTALGSKAGERLGLGDSLAQTFGSGYSWVRTGSLALNGREGHKEIIKQLFFFKLFFPVGGFYNWDFSSPIVKRKLGLVFCKFRSWHDNPDSYIQDVRDCREQLEPLWHGLLLALGFPKIDWVGAYETYKNSIINEI